MSQIAGQASFNAGEWAPNLNARVDLQKYHAGAALLENFVVDYRGGASSRTGSQYIIQCKDSAHQVRLITFQASFNIGYTVEIGNGYMRFIYNSAMVLENSFTVSGATQANPCVLDIVGNNYVVGDVIYLASIGGMTQLNNQFFLVAAVSGNNITIADLNNVNINSTSYTAYTSGGTAARVYTIPSPYTSADDLRLIKFALSINQMILCHPNHPTYILTLVSATDWTLVQLSVGSTSPVPTNLSISTTLGLGTTNYSYGVTSIDDSGQESSMSTAISLVSADIRTTAGSNQITWTIPQGAVAFNVYESDVSYFGVVPYGVQYGFIGTTKGNTFVDSNISPDFTETPPVSQNPFTGSGVDTVTITAAGVYTTVPIVSFVGSATIVAEGITELQIPSSDIPAITSGGTGFVVGDTVQFGNSVVLTVTAVSSGVITAWVTSNPGSITSGLTPTNPVAQTNTSGVGTGATATMTWGVGQVIIETAGAGYTAAPTVSFNIGTAAATATLSPTSNGNPTVPSFFQQRLVLAGPPGAPQTFYLSQPGAYFNFNISSPSQASDAITATLVSNEFNTIKSIVSSTAGMLILTDKASWIVNGGQSGSAVSPSAIVANAQSWIGASDVPPITANYDVLYVQSKGSGVRDLAYNIYFSVFTGTDISILSSHLFYGFSILEWAWAEQPFYIVWAVRNDGVLLSLTFLKEQDFTGWAHHYTNNGTYQSVTAVTEPTANAGNVDAVYTVVKRTINGNVVQYIERFAERVFPNGVVDAWCVDCALQYSGSATTSFSGATQLAGQTVTGVADGKVITPFTMPVSGDFTLPTAASVVTIGIGYNCDLQTLALDLGEPTVQGKVKKITNVDVRVFDTLGLSIGNDFNNLTPMKDLVVGNVSSMLTGQASQTVTDLVTGDARTFLNPTYTVPGQYCIRQSNPFPASVLGVFPSFIIGDAK